MVITDQLFHFKNIVIINLDDQTFLWKFLQERKKMFDLSLSFEIDLLALLCKRGQLRLDPAEEIIIKLGRRINNSSNRKTRLVT